MKKTWINRFLFIFVVTFVFALTILELMAAWKGIWIFWALCIGAILWVALAVDIWFSKNEGLDKPQKHIFRIAFTFLAVLAVSSLLSPSSVKIALWLNTALLGFCSIVCIGFFRQGWQKCAKAPTES